MFSPNAQAGPSRQPEPSAGPESGRDDSSGLKRQSTTQQDEQDNKKRRRKTYSCTECHRLKSKCDRQIPCGACIKRETTDECSLWSKLAPKPDHQRPYAEIQAQYAHVPIPVANPQYQRQQHMSSATTTTAPSNASYRNRSQSHGQQALFLTTKTEHTNAPSLLMMVTAGVDGVSPVKHTVPAVTQTISRVPAAQSCSPAGDLATAEKARQLATAVSFERGMVLDASKDSERHDDDESDGSDDERDGMETGHGTLMIDDHGHSFFLGSTAGSEWLREPEEDTMTPYPVGGRRAGFGNAGHIGMAPTAPQSLFPFPIANMDPLTAVEMMLKQLPERTEAKVLANCYFRHMAWHYTLVDRKSFDEDAEIIYAASYAREPSMSMLPIPTRKEPKLDQLALFFSVLAVGAQYNLELPPNDPISSHYCSLAQCCLSMANFMVQNTIYGVQTLHLMGHYFLSHDQRGDSTWPLWGLLMRIVQAMGLHRDGSRWGLPPDVVDQRRRVFWECHAAEVLQAACFSRPNCIQADQIDTEFPLEETPMGEMGFINLRNKLILIALPALRQVLSVRKPSYHQTQKIWRELIEFERNIPYNLRCKPAWSAIVSLSQTQEGGATVAPDAPEVIKHDFPLTFQQHTLALNVTETVLSLNRLWFMRGLCDTTKELSESKYYPSVLAVFERCLALSAITQSLTTLFPALAYRHWYFWHHAFGACTAFSTVIIVRPACFLAPFAMAEINTIVDLFAGAPPGSRPRTSLDSLIKIQRRAQERLNAKTAPPNDVLDDMTATFGVVLPDPLTPGDDDDDKHIPMMGWDTRLVRMLKAGAQRRGVAISCSVPRSEAGKAKQTTPESASPSVSAPATAASVEPTTTAEATAPASMSHGDQPIPFDRQGATPVTNQDWEFWMDWIKTCGSSNPEDFAHF